MASETKEMIEETALDLTDVLGSSTQNETPTVNDLNTPDHEGATKETINADEEPIFCPRGHAMDKDPMYWEDGGENCRDGLLRSQQLLADMNSQFQKEWSKKVFSRPLCYKDAPKEIKNNKEILLEVIQRGGGFNLAYASRRLKDDQEIVLEAVKRDGYAMRYASSRLQDNKEIVLEAVKRDGGALECTSFRLKDDKEVILLAAMKSGHALQYASTALQDDKDIVLKAVKKHGRALQYASTRLQDHKEVVLEAVKMNGSALKYASSRLKDDEEIVFAAVKKDGGTLEYTSPRLQDDKEIVLEAVKKDVYAMQYASSRLQDETEFVWEAVKVDAYALRYVSSRLQEDKEFVLAVLEQKGGARAINFVSNELLTDKDFVISMVSINPLFLKYADNGLNQDPDCLRAAGLWDKNYQSSGASTNRKIVLSTRFSLKPESKSSATHFTLLLKNHEYIHSGQFTVYSPNAYDKSTCDPNWTNFDWPCRGTFETCKFEPSLKTGEPQKESCWRYSFRYQLEEAKRTNGFMIQLVETSKKKSDADEQLEHVLGDGQRIEQQLAKEMHTKVLQVYEPIEEHYIVRRDEDRQNTYDFTKDHIKNVIDEIQKWYDGECADTSEIIIKYPIQYVENEWWI